MERFEPGSSGEQFCTDGYCPEAQASIGMLGLARVAVSKIDQFWQYAKEAIFSACYAKTEEDKQDLLELARIWTQAALQERKSSSRSRQPL